MILKIIVFAFISVVLYGLMRVLTFTSAGMRSKKHKAHTGRGNTFHQNGYGSAGTRAKQNGTSKGAKKTVIDLKKDKDGTYS